LKPVKTKFDNKFNLLERVRTLYKINLIKNYYFDFLFVRVEQVWSNLAAAAVRVAVAGADTTAAATHAAANPAAAAYAAAAGADTPAAANAAAGAATVARAGGVRSAAATTASGMYIPDAIETATLPSSMAVDEQSGLGTGRDRDNAAADAALVAAVAATTVAAAARNMTRFLAVCT
jgi:hypothetical protein